MPTDLSYLLAGRPLVAVVGASDHPYKFGGRIYRYLKEKGHRVVAVNPNRPEVDGDLAYPDLASLPAPPDIINLVVPADVGVTVVGQAARLGLDNIWVQPGAEGPELEARLAAGGFAYSVHDCIMNRT